MKEKVKVIRKEYLDCSICGEKHELDFCEELCTSEIEGEKVEYIANYYRCNKYNTENTFVTGGMWNKQLVAMQDAYRIKKNLKPNQTK